jgi:prolyl oligopeptidase
MIRSVPKVLLAMLVLVSTTLGQRLAYPTTKKVDQVDAYFGIEVRDPYRWLEDEMSTERDAWIAEQNAITFKYLETIPFRQKVKERLERLFDYPKYSTPFRKGENFLFYKNEGLQNQSVLYIQKGLTGAPEILLDPNTFSEDGTTRLTGFTLSKDGRYACYGISRGGIRLAGILHDGHEEPENSPRHAEVGEGLRHRLAGEWILLQSV